MSKELPYFKFDAAEWINGSITLESDSVQGLFITICAHYWFKSGKLTVSEIKRRLFKSKPEDFQTLFENGLIRDEAGMIRVDFLDEQFNERATLSKVNSANGRLGGRPKSEKKAVGFVSVSEKKANESNIEEKRIEENRINTPFVSKVIKPFNPEDYYSDPAQAFEDCKQDEQLIENLVRIVQRAGNASANALTVTLALKKFITVESAKPDFPNRSRKEVRRHLVNWINKNATTLNNGI